MTLMTTILALAYLTAGLAALGFIHAPRRISPRPARVCAVIVFCLQTLFLVCEVVWYGDIPIRNLSEALFIFLWFTVLVAIFVERAYRIPSLIAYLMPLMMLFAVPAMLLASRHAHLPRDLAPLWLVMHTVPTFLGYGLFTIGFVASVMFLTQEYRLKTHRTGPLAERLPSLAMLDTVARKAVLYGFPIFTFGLGLGVVWARTAADLLGGPWYHDSKIISGAVTWVIYVLLLHVRLAAVWHGRKVAYLTIAGFLCVVFTFVGTFLLGGRHAYKTLTASEKAQWASPGQFHDRHSGPWT